MFFIVRPVYNFNISVLKHENPVKSDLSAHVFYSSINHLLYCIYFLPSTFSYAKSINLEGVWRLINIILGLFSFTCSLFFSKPVLETKFKIHFLHDRFKFKLLVHIVFKSNVLFKGLPAFVSSAGGHDACFSSWTLQFTKDTKHDKIFLLLVSKMLVSSYTFNVDEIAISNSATFREHCSDFMNKLRITFRSSDTAKKYKSILIVHIYKDTYI